MKKLGIALIGLLLLAAPSMGATLFFSTASSAPTLANPTVNLAPSGSAVVYLWAAFDNTTEKLNGLGIDFVCTTTGIAHASSATTYNPYYDAMELDRWNTPVNSGAVGQLVTGGNAVSVNAAGLKLRTSDPYYDATSQCIKVGEVTVVGDTIGSTTVFIKTNTSTVSYATGGPTIGFGAGDAYVNPTTPGVQSSVADMTINVVPEPATMALLGLGGLGLLVRRSRKA